MRSLVLVGAILVPAATYSYVNAMTAPGSAPWGARTVEWISDHGGRGLVLFGERLWYSWHTPPVGGTPRGGLPYAAGTREHARPNPMPAASSPSPAHERPPSERPRPHPQPKLPPHLPLPAPVPPLVAHPLPHEGTWQAAGPRVHGLPTGEVAFLRPDDVHTSLVAGLLWMDTKLVKARLYAGSQEPGTGRWQRYAEIPRSRRAGLAFTFNSGFRMKDSRGGWYSEGTTAVPLVNGAASLVVSKDGSATVGQWGRDVGMSSRVASVRQNLSLIVDHGRPVPSLATDSFQQWGATLGNAELVWRSGVGVLPDGALVYAAGPGLSIQTLASLLAHAGCLRAMELDINTDWVTANWYGPAPRSAFGVIPHKLLPDMIRSPYRYLVPDERDFVALYAR